VDAAYTNMPTLRPLVAAGLNVLGRVSAKRVFYLPPPPYPGSGRPRVRGHKLQLSDQRTLPLPAYFQRVEKADGGWYEISQWAAVRRWKWPPQPLVLVMSYNSCKRRVWTGATGGISNQVTSQINQSPKEELPYAEENSTE
jgi:hypothetical protein